jgi:hypothetical protein
MHARIMKSLGVLAAGAIFAQPAPKGSKFEVASVVATVTGAYASAYMARQSTGFDGAIVQQSQSGKLFGRAESVKFFLTKDRLREVIVKV